MRLPTQVAGRGPGRGRAGRRGVEASRIPEAPDRFSFEACLRSEGVSQGLIDGCGTCARSWQCWQNCLYHGFGGQRATTTGILADFHPDLFPTQNLNAFLQTSNAVKAALQRC